MTGAQNLAVEHSVRGVVELVQWFLTKLVRTAALSASSKQSSPRCPLKCGIAGFIHMEHRAALFGEMSAYSRS